MIGDLIESATVETLKLLDFNICSKGYKYLLDTIIMLNNRSVDSLGEAYNILSIRYGVDGKSIRSVVQRFIKNSMKRSNHEAIVGIFGYDITRNEKGRNYYLTSEFVYFLMSYMNSKYK